MSEPFPADQPKQLSQGTQAARTSLRIGTWIGVCLFLGFVIWLLTLRAGRKSPDPIAASVGDCRIALDQYGGYLVKSGRSTGFFRVERINERWYFVDPVGNPFWMRSVYNIDPYSYEGTARGKYGSIPRWAVQTVRRLRSWGFNTIGEYSGNALFPVGVYGGRDGNTEKMPFIGFLAPGMSALRNARGLAKSPTLDIMAGIPQQTYNDWRSPLVDFYAPQFEEYVKNYVKETVASFTESVSRTPWLVGWTIDDADKWYGLAGGAMSGCPTQYPHPGWMVAVTNYDQGGGHSSGSHGDLKVYSKYALRDFLAKKYGTISALNAAWKSNYTTFDSDRGYGVGHGFLDEDGRHPWMGRDWKNLNDASPSVRADLDAFLLEFARKAFSVIVSNIRAADRNHLIFGPAALNKFGCLARPQVFQAAAEFVDALQVSGDFEKLSNNLTVLGRTFDLTGKPLFVWTGFMANPDSPLTGHPNIYGMPPLKTQQDRGEYYAKFLLALLSVRGSNGTYPAVGLDWWDWMDSGGEGANWGLVTFRDNAYDGKEAVIAPGADPWRFAAGGEARNYGDFLSAVTRANRSIPCVLGLSSTPAAPPPPRRSP